jgi:hypothetical protein
VQSFPIEQIIAWAILQNTDKNTVVIIPAEFFTAKWHNAAQITSTAMKDHGV